MTTTRRLGEAVRTACLDAALTGYEDAAIRGLCHEGAWEAALSAIRTLDLDALAEASARAGEERRAGEPLAAERAAAGTGALAAALLEGVAALSARHGPEEFRRRARSIASRAASLESALHATRATTTDSLIDVAMRCAQVTTLAAEVAKEGGPATRSEAAAASQLAASAAECVLALQEEELHVAAENDGTRSTRRRVWRARLLLRRARPAPEADGAA